MSGVGAPGVRASGGAVAEPLRRADGLPFGLDFGSKRARHPGTPPSPSQLRIAVVGAGWCFAGGAHAPAGTKGLSNLLRSDKWSAADIAFHLWQGAQEQVAQEQVAQEQVAQEQVAQWQVSAPDVARAVEQTRRDCHRDCHPGVLPRLCRGSNAEGQKPLWRLACRSGGGREPWYLLTNEPVENAEQAWRIGRGYARRMYRLLGRARRACATPKARGPWKARALSSWERRAGSVASN